MTGPNSQPPIWRGWYVLWAALFPPVIIILILRDREAARQNDATARHYRHRGNDR